MARRFEKMIPIPTRSERVIWWVRHFCIVPDGPNRGQPAMLLPEQEAQVRRIYDRGKDGTVAAPLAAYLALLHVAGPMAREDPPPLEAVDPWTVWRCASEPLRAVLRRDRERIVCPELGNDKSGTGRALPSAKCVRTRRPRSICGRPARVRDVQPQNALKPARCHRRIVSG